MQNGVIHKISTLYSHNRNAVIGVVLGVGVWVFVIACTPTTDSPFTPGRDVTRSQLQAQSASYEALLAGAHADLDEQEARQAVIQSTALSLMQTVVPGSGPLAVIASMIASGLVVENRRKEKVIVKEQKKNTTGG